MLDNLSLLFAAVRNVFRSRSSLIRENQALRQRLDAEVRRVARESGKSEQQVRAELEAATPGGIVRRLMQRRQD